MSTTMTDDEWLTATALENLIRRGELILVKRPNGQLAIKPAERATADELAAAEADPRDPHELVQALINSKPMH